MFINHYIRFGNPKNYAIFASEIQSIHFNEKKNMGLEEILNEYFKEEASYEFLEEVEQAPKDTFLEKDRTFATNLIISTDFDDAKIATLVGINEDFVKKLRQELGK